MIFSKFYFAADEIVVFVDESGDESRADPNNPIFVLGACFVRGRDLQSVLRDRWSRLRQRVRGSEHETIHMRQLSRRAGKSFYRDFEPFFDDARIGRVSFAVTNRTAFQSGEFPFDPVLQLALRHLLVTIAEMISGVPSVGLSVVFADGPLRPKIEPILPTLMLNLDGVPVPTCWAFLPSDAKEPGLEVADFISHTSAGFLRSGRQPGSKFEQPFRCLFKADEPRIGKSLELNAAEFMGWNPPDQPLSGAY